MNAALIRAAGAAMALICSAVAVTAQVPVCMELEARLARLQNPGGGQSGQYDEAINRQRFEISRARTEARRFNCSGGFIFFQQNRDPRCGALLDTIRQMEQNLSRLEATREQNRYRASPGEMQQVLRMLANNNCGPQYARYGGSQWSSDPDNDFFGRRNWWSSSPFGSWGAPTPRISTYRTLCVRTCDGYYFPISFSTVNSRFAQDEATCRSMCPGTDVKLYVHYNPGEESEAMVSLSGEPYAQLPTAFLYRDHYIKACSCGRPTVDYAAIGDQPATIAGVPVGISSAGVSSFVPAPLKRPSPSEDPETIANRRGDFVPAPPQLSVPGAVAELTGPDGKRVRLVGPSYYYAQ